MKWLGRLSLLVVLAIVFAGGVLAVQMLRSDAQSGHHPHGA